MKNLILSSALVLIASSAAQAQEAVQWKVSDGGNGHWYQLRLSNPGLGWTAAQNAADAAGGYLATLTSAPENSFVFELANVTSAYGGSPVVGPWIGGRRTRDQWSWVNGDEWIFVNWLPPNPDGPGTWGEDRTCLTSSAGQWNDFNESGVQPGLAMRSYVVEWSADCNNDGIVDYGQCRDGTLPDYDGDNIPDCCESGTTCVVGSYPVQWRVAEGGNGHWYKIRPKVGDWHACRSAALAAGADLASPSTSAENLFVERFVPSPSGSSLNRVFIGGRQAPGSSPTVGWYWIDGSDWDYTDWQFNQPNGNEGYLAVFVYGATVVWGDYVADSIDLCCFLVEWSADCNNDGIVDYGQILDGTFPDANGNGVPDCCDGGGSCTPCSGDVASDGMVDGVDLAAVLSQWGTQGSGTFNADIDDSGLVDGGDLALVLGGWGPCPQ